ncbi:Abi family protein [Flavobacterium sp. 7A]|uniref:Abi family protein n=1 Tax=Flavobacterium sp. 7A TaxID=2940571 RepID=UPI002225EAD1|nr:Abi family protein [Flavobacterium sp. 7A]MCW2119100.1 abortive infection bacteriophage resistance protein [Flavobacterium sp. 7A]
MAGIATNVDDQVLKLQDRGMVLDLEIEKVKEILLDIGYYRLGFYWNPFEINSDHIFKDGTLFSNAVTLYYLDVDLRNLLLKYLNRIEINFRTKLVYYVSNKYKSSPTWFINPRVIDIRYINTIGKYYNEDFKRTNKTIKLHHLNNINDLYAPAWKTLEFFTFGAVLKTFKSLNDGELKVKVANLYGILNLSKFINLFDTIVYVRNTCAHGGVLFDFKTPKGIASLPNISFNNNNRHSLDSAIKIISFILKSVSNERANDLDRDLNQLFNKHSENEIIKGIIENKIGFKF